MAKKKTAVKKIATIKFSGNLPQPGTRLWIENQKYEAVDNTTVKNKEGKVFKVI